VAAAPSTDPFAALLEALAEQLADLVASRIASALQHAPSGEPAWLDVESAADYLSTSPEAIRSAIKRGRLPGRRPNGRVLFSREELDRYVLQGRA
jgi:excisionase family DNA binding protein